MNWKQAKVLPHAMNSRSLNKPSQGTPLEKSDILQLIVTLWVDQSRSTNLWHVDMKAVR